MSFFTSLATRYSPLAAAERTRLILWMPVLVGMGAAVYFGLAREPSALLLAGLWGVSAVGALLLRNRRYAWAGLVPVLFMTGMAAGCLRTRLAETPLIPKEMRFVQLAGTVRDVLLAEDGVKLVISQPVIEGLEAEETPRSIRVTYRKYRGGIESGDAVSLKAMLYPLPPLAMPGAFDFGRYFYFQGIGAVGYAAGPVEVTAPGERSGVMLAIDKVRHAIAGYLMQHLPEPEGAIAVALSVGDMGAVPKEANEAMRDAGLSHVLSISGLHLALAAGLMYFTLRLLFSLYPPWALRLPVKKIAAAGALTSAFAYLLLAGSPVPAQRSFIMVAFVLVAVMLDRRGVSLRSLSLAALFILLLLPESAMGVSFQMSFAATLAIVRLYERFGGRLYRAEAKPVARAAYYFLGIAATSLAASLATAPFVLYHFNRVSLVGIVSNMLVVPLASFVIMPGVVLMLLLLPLGLAWPGMRLLETGIGWMMDVAHWTASLPLANLLLPAPSDAGFVLAILGLLWLCLWKTRLALLGIPLMLAGIATASLHRAPDMFISADGRQVMARGEDGKYAMLKGSADGFVPQVWLRSAGEKEARRIACEGKYCVMEVNGKRLVALKHSEALERACAEEVEVLAIWWYVKPWKCPGAKLLIDRNRLERGGAHALTFTPQGVEVETAKSRDIRRPWTVASGKDSDGDADND